MRPVTRFSLAFVSDASDNKAELMMDGKPTGLRLAAGSIRGQYECRHGYLLVVWNVLFEGEELRFFLLSAKPEVLDALYFSEAGIAAQASAELEGLVTAGDRLEFVFGGTRYAVDVREKPSAWPQEWFSLKIFREDDYAKCPRYLGFSKVS